MDFKVIQSLNLLEVNQNGVFSLFRLGPDSDEGSFRMTPVKFAQNLPFLKVDTDSRLIFTPAAVYSFDSLKDDAPLCSFSGKTAEVISLSGGRGNTNRFLVVSAIGEMRQEYEFFLWNRKKIILQGECREYVYTDDYLAVKQDCWHIFNMKGKELLKNMKISADSTISLSRHFLKVSNMCATKELYSLPRGKLLCKDQLLIECSRTENFALCATIGEKARMFFNGDWKNVENAEGFGILDDESHLFYVLRNGRYFLYLFGGETILDNEFPSGASMVAFNRQEKAMLITTDLNAHFFVKQEH